MQVTGKFHFAKINSPRSAYLLGPKNLLAQAQKMEELTRGELVGVNLPNIGNIPAYKIALGQEEIYEIKEAAALKIIENFGLKLGKDGIASEVIEGA